MRWWWEKMAPTKPTVSVRCAWTPTRWTTSKIWCVWCGLKPTILSAKTGMCDAPIVPTLAATVHPTTEITQAEPISRIVSLQLHLSVSKAMRWNAFPSQKILPVRTAIVTSSAVQRRQWVTVKYVKSISVSIANSRILKHWDKSGIELYCIKLKSSLILLKIDLKKVTHVAAGNISWRFTSPGKSITKWEWALLSGSWLMREPSGGNAGSAENLKINWKCISPASTAPTQKKSKENPIIPKYA